MHPFNVLTRQRILLSPLIQSNFSDTNAILSCLIYYNFYPRSFSHCWCSIHQTRPKACLRWSVKFVIFVIASFSYVLHISFDSNSREDSKGPVRWRWMRRRGINFCVHEQLHIANVPFNIGPLRSSSCFPRCHWVLDSWYVILNCLSNSNQYVIHRGQAESWYLWKFRDSIGSNPLYPPRGGGADGSILVFNETELAFRK